MNPVRGRLISLSLNHEGKDLQLPETNKIEPK